MDTTDRHPSTSHIAQFFTWAHLPAHLQPVSRLFHDLAADLLAILPDGPELTAALRKILEAKDCAVRAAVDATTAAADLATALTPASGGPAGSSGPGSGVLAGDPATVPGFVALTNPTGGSTVPVPVGPDFQPLAEAPTPDVAG